MALGGSGNTDKQLKLRLIVESDAYLRQLAQAIQSTDNFQKRIELLEKFIPAMAAQTGQSFEEITAAIRKSSQELELFSETTSKTANVALKNLQTEAEGVVEEAEEMTGAFSGLSNIMQGVIGGVFGVSLIQALRSVVDWFGRAAEAGREFGRALFQLEVAVRGLRRVGINTDLQEFRDEITRLRGEFRLYTERELTEAIAGIALFTRDIGLNKDEIFELTEASAALAIVTGKDVGEQGFAIARAIASGYTEALQRAGIAISKTTIASKALELGINKGFMAMTEQERATVTLALVMERLAPIQEDLAEFQETYAGRIAVAEQAQRNLTEQMGRRLLPLLAVLQEGLGRAADGFLALDGIIRSIVVGGLSNILGVIVGLSAALSALATGAEVSGRTIANSIVEARNQIRGALADIAFGADEGLGALPELGEPTFVASDDEQATAEEQVQRDIEEELIKGQQRRFQLILDWQRKVSELIRDFAARRAQLERQLQQRLEEVTIRFAERRANLIEDYEIRRAAVIRQFQLRQDELNRRFRQKELDDEARFQEELRQLRENFILDLEDAVRERDARQIIRLTRQFNLRRQQMIRERELEKQENGRDFVDRQKQINDQRNERLRQLDIEHRARLARLDRQERLEIEKQQRAHENRMQEEQIRFEERKAELDRRREEDLQDLDRQIQNRLELQIKGWVEEGKITRDNVNAIYNTLAATFGPGGRVEGLYIYTVSLLQLIGEATAQAAGMAAQAYGMFEGGSGATPGEQNAAGGGFQQGGTVFADRPTVAVFGEAGPEFATFTPVGRRGADVGRVFGNVPSGVGGPGLMGAIELAVLLSPDLEARIVNNTLDRTADVIFSLERSRR